MAKLKVDTTGRGKGTLTLEKGTAGDKPIVLIVFRNEFKSVLFQGQLMRNVSKLIKASAKKPQKIQRFVTAVAKIDEKKTGVVKCILTVYVLLHS